MKDDTTALTENEPPTSPSRPSVSDAASRSAARPRGNWLTKLNPASALAMFAAVILLLRLFLLLADLDPVQERIAEVFEYSPTPWTEGPARTLYDREELYTATAAEAIRQGLDIPVSMYQFMDYGGGSLVVTLLAVPLLSLFGPHYLVFKIIALAVTVLGGVAWTWLAFAWFGRTAGWAMGLLYLFAPSVFVRTMLIAKGDHAEAATWIGLTLMCASLAARGPLGRLPGEPHDLGAAVVEGKSGTRWAFAAGLMFGIGVFLTYSTIPVLATVFAIALLATRLRPRRIWNAGFLGLGIGLLPWVWNLIQSKGSALKVYGATLGQGQGISAVGERIQSLVTTGFFATYDLGASVRNLTALLFTIGVVVGWILLLRSVFETRKGWPQNARVVASLMIVIAAAGHLAAFCLSAPDASSRYIVPAYPLLLLAVAALVAPARRDSPEPESDDARLASSRRSIRKAWILPGLIVLLGASAQIVTLTKGSYRSLATPLRATDWPLLGEIVGQKLAPETIAQLPETVQSQFWVGFGKRVFGFVDRVRWNEAFALAPQNSRPFVWEGIGIAWVESGTVLDAGTFVESLPEPDRDGIVRGMQRYGEIVFAPTIAAGEDLTLVRSRMAGSYATPLASAQARVFGILEANGATLPRGRGLFAEEIAAGRGIAQYGGIGNTGLAVRKVASGVPVALGDLAIAPPPSEVKPQWYGFLSAFIADLALVDPHWVLEAHNPNGPEKLAAVLDRSARNLSPELAMALYGAAGRATARIWLDPSVDAKTRTLRPEWGWKRSIPAQHHASFESGLLLSREE